MTHEFGHLLSMGHADLRDPLTTGTTQADIDAIPTMYWELITPLQSTLEADDKAWISKLYPYFELCRSVRRYHRQCVLLGWKVSRAGRSRDRTVTQRHSQNGSVQHLGIPLSRAIRDSRTLPTTCPVPPSTACVGGTLGANPGSQFGWRDASLVGSYEIPVPPGQYTLEVQEISGGAIGPISPFLPLPGTGATLPGVVTVQPGQTLSDVNIILPGTDPPFDIF